MLLKKILSILHGLVFVMLAVDYLSIYCYNVLDIHEDIIDTLMAYCVFIVNIFESSDCISKMSRRMGKPTI